MHNKHNILNHSMALYHFVRPVTILIFRTLHVWESIFKYIRLYIDSTFYCAAPHSLQIFIVIVGAKFLWYYFPVRREVVCHFAHCPSVKTSGPHCLRCNSIQDKYTAWGERAAVQLLVWPVTTITLSTYRPIHAPRRTQHLRRVQLI